MRRTFLAFVVILGAVSAWAQTDPAIGTWKLNPAKSKYDPGPVPKSNTIVITAAGEGRLKVSASGTDGNGNPTSVEYTVATDRKDVPVKGAPAYDGLSASRIDPNTTQLTRKKGGKVVQTATRAVSSDGKTMTVTTTGTDEKGRKINTVAVFDKQ
jgi:hypothetical protein